MTLVDVSEHQLQLLMQRLDPDGDRKLCPDCQCCELVWEMCEECEGDGWVEDDDPDEFYAEPEIVPCGTCGRKGGWSVCGGRCDDKGEHPKLCAACHDTHAGVCAELTLTGAA